ncbi:ATP-binding cassette domain-containing protein [Streptacidiphilus sp. MAP5-3]|uniref:ABC transporter ATP-binding protein n=1 Tax=unclassified Streptacidiphilus TaxID=2643834 RepID=UPI003512A3F9
MAGDAPAIDVSGLVKTFGRTRALDGLDLRVERGEVHGFLGPNGAGKSTTIRVLLGLIRADAGSARLLGGDPWRESVALHRRIAYVPGDVTLWRGLSGGEVIDLLGRLRGNGNTTAEQRAERRAELLERFELDPTKKGQTYSKGNRQKVALVAAFCSDAELLILDEPTSGLDPLMEEVFRSCVAEERARGRTVLLSSHILSEVEALCDRVSIIRAGRTVETGTLSELRHLTRTSVTAELASRPTGLDALPGLHDVELADGPAGARLHCQVDTDRLDGLLRALTDAGVRSLTSRPPTLEELFLRHYESAPDADPQAAVTSSVASESASAPRSSSATSSVGEQA